MAQAKKKIATRTKKQAVTTCKQKNCRKQQSQGPNTYFVMAMSFLAATLLFASLLMMTV